MRKLFSVLAILALFAAIPAMAAQGDKIIRFGVAYVSPTGDLTDREDDPPYLYITKIEADGGVGGFFGFEFMVSDLIGIDGTLLYANNDVDICAEEYFDGELVFDESLTIGDISMMPLLVSAHFHVVQNEALDWYVGPTLGYVMYGDLKFDPIYEDGSIPIKDDFGVGMVTGMDVPMGTGGWNFAWALRYLKTGAQIDGPIKAGPDTIDQDPWMVQIGAGKRW